MRYALEFVPIATGLVSCLFVVLGYKRAKRKQREREET